MYKLSDAKLVASLLNIQFDNFTIEEFLEGLNIEKEHGSISPATNVTNDDLLLLLR